MPFKQFLTQAFMNVLNLFLQTDSGSNRLIVTKVQTNLLFARIWLGQTLS